METSQGNSLKIYKKQTKNVIFFSFYKSENRRAKQVLSGGIGTSVMGRM
jgi:hypothetical protein